MTHSKYQICKYCIMDTNIDHDITFNDEGICNHCENYARRIAALGPEKHKQLETLIASIKAKGKNKEYDCIIGVSGGVDSTYVAYLTKKFGLRPLAIHLDNGWNTELSVSNIENVLKKLDIDLRTHVIDWEEFKNLQLSFLRASVANAEIPTDHAITAILFREAAKRNIHYIIGGGNIVTECIMPDCVGYDSRDWKHIKAIHRQFGKIKLKTFPHISLLHILYYIFIRRIRYVSILNYTNYVKKEVLETLKSELDWKEYPGKHYESIFTRFFQGYYLPTKFGFDKRRAHFSTLINSKQMTREQALAEIETPPYHSEELLQEDLEYVKKKFGLTDKEFDEIMTSPLKTYRDYPSHAWLFHNTSLYERIKNFMTK